MFGVGACAPTPRGLKSSLQTFRNSRTLVKLWDFDLGCDERLMVSNECLSVSSDSFNVSNNSLSIGNDSFNVSSDSFNFVTTV